MTTIARRLRALERRFAPVAASEQTLWLRARLDAARRRCGLAPPSPERVVELRHMSVVEIVGQGRERALARTRNVQGLVVSGTPMVAGHNRGKP